MGCIASRSDPGGRRPPGLGGSLAAMLHEHPTSTPARLVLEGTIPGASPEQVTAAFTDAAAITTWWAPEVDIAAVRAACGWELEAGADVAETPPPTEAELAAVRALDPDRTYLR